MVRLLPRRLIRSIAIGVLFTAPMAFWPQSATGSDKSRPDLENVAYGPNERNVLDLWKAKSEKATPLVVFIHGGGFFRGSKEGVSSRLRAGLLAHGISVMAINYRLSPEVCFPTHYLDCARAIQFARYNAKEWNLDPQRIGCTGGSAGAGTSLWLGFHDELAESTNDDPVLRQSTRLSCVAVTDAQTSYDPRVIKEWIGESAASHRMFDIFYRIMHEERETPKAYRLYEQASPINHVSVDDPSVYANFSEGGPLPVIGKPGQGIHHIKFGWQLQEKMDALSIECIIRSHQDRQDWDNDMIEFFTTHLR